MPYIKQIDRSRVDVYNAPVNAGELNYTITKMIHAYVKSQGLKYQTLNDVVGALEGAKAEFQRRVISPYEDKKITENGDL